MRRSVRHITAFTTPRSRQHKGWWQEGWQERKAQRLSALARVLASSEFASLIRGSAELRRLFSRDMPATPPRRTGPDYRHKPRNKPKDEYVDPFDLSKWTWPDLGDLLGRLGGDR